MAYNRNLVTGTRSTRDSAKKQQYRQTKFDSAPRIEFRNLLDGQYRFRFWPEDAKNPHGYLDNRVHRVPQGWIRDGVDPRFVKMQCPRSSNWDPAVIDPTTGEERYNERCACCELDEWVFNTPYDTDFPDGTYVIDALDEGLQDIIAKIDFRANSWDSGLFLPCTITAVVHTKEKSEDGFETVTYRPGGTEDLLSAVLKIWHPDFSERLDENGVPHPKNGVPEQLIRYLEQCPDANDLQFGRWFTLTKTNGGSGANGYTLMPDPYPSPFPKEKVEYNKIYDFNKWGDKTRKKPSIRLPYHQQIAILSQADWAHSLRAMDVPITDADVDILDSGQSLVPDSGMSNPNSVTPETGYPVSAPPSPPSSAYTPYATPTQNPSVGMAYPTATPQQNPFGQSGGTIGSPFSGGTQFGGFPQ